MRLGTGLLVLGVGGAGLLGLTHISYGPHMQNVLTQRATEALGMTVHGTSVSVVGRDITVSGIADGPQERARIIADLTAVDGRRVVRDELDVLPVVDPFPLTATWQGADQSLSVAGHAPTQAARARLTADATGDLPLAAGAPDGWTDAALAAMGALEPLESGQAQIAGNQITITGTARTPEEGAAVSQRLASLPDGYTQTVTLDFLDDGTPPAYDIRFRADSGVGVSGKLPRGIDAAEIAEALGMNAVDSDATQALTGPDGAVPPALGALAPWMRDLEGFDMSVGPDGSAVTALVGQGADTDLIMAALGADLADSGSTLSVTESQSTAQDGDTRQNVITGQTERFSGGFWIPVAAFDPDPEVCSAETTAALAAYRIGFVTGSAQLDARARGAVNALASVMGPCIDTAGLSAEIGGHTDNTGSDEGNQALSQARADAVVQALIARGIPADALSAQGYGPSQPIASNDTDEGRAANRRTTVVWTQQ